jgi:hypothetical protein
VAKILAGLTDDRKNFSRFRVYMGQAFLEWRENKELWLPEFSREA